MLNYTELCVRTAEHNRRIGKIDEYGWLRSSLRPDRKTTGLRAISNAVARCLSRRATQRVAASSSDGVPSAAAKRTESFA
jgi:hypothetical protein